MSKKILIIDKNEISKNQLQDLLDSSEFLAYHVTSMEDLEEYIEYLGIDLVLINQNSLIGNPTTHQKIASLKIPVIILASIFYNNLKLELDELKQVKIIRLPKPAKNILAIIKESIFTKNGECDYRYINR